MPTTQWINQTSPGVPSTSATTRAPTTPNLVAPYSPDSCQNVGYIRLLNGTCTTKPYAQVIQIKKHFNVYFFFSLSLQLICFSYR
jgi:hypothetical protein